MDWEFDTSLGNERINSLKDAPSFEEITAKIKEEMEVLCFHPDYFCDNKKDNYQYDRPVYCIEVGNKLFDWFFNSQNGYRAEYFRSPTNGLKANQHFIESLMPNLIASDKTTPIFDKKFIEESLKLPSAKVWLVEYKGFKNRDGRDCELCKEWKHPIDDHPEILNNKWESLDDKKGCKAPELTKIRIVGAFLNKHYDVLIPERKRFRSEEIHDKGWT